MIRRSLLVAIGLAAVICLSGCVIHGHGRKGVHTGTTHPAHVYNVTQRPDPVHPHGTHGDNGKHKGYDKHRGRGKHKGHDHDD